MPPCGGAEPRPAYAALGAPPATEVWTGAWQPPPCTGWPQQMDGVLVALAAQFPHAGSSDALLLRLGAISSLKGLQYWSVTEGGYRTFIIDASALSGPDLGLARGDFTLQELRSGKPLYFAQSDNRASGAVLYRMQIKEMSATRLVVAVENASAVRRFMLTLFSPGDLRSLHFLERAGPKVWRYYGLAFAAQSAASKLAVPEASYLNRAKALYAHLTGVKDKRP